MNVGLRNVLDHLRDRARRLKAVPELQRIEALRHKLDAGESLGALELSEIERLPLRCDLLEKP